MRLHNDAKVDLISRVPLLASCSKKELRSTVSVSRAGERINDLTAGEWVGESLRSSQMFHALRPLSRRRRSELSC